MSDTYTDHLKTLHTSAIDARNGYREALEAAEGNGMTPLFNEMIALHQSNADGLARELSQRGEKADESGSFMTVVHTAIMDIRGLFGGLGKSVLSGLIDGEKRNVAKYDEALKVQAAPLLEAQRGALLRKIAEIVMRQDS